MLAYFPQRKFLFSIAFSKNLDVHWPCCNVENLFILVAFFFGVAGVINLLLVGLVMFYFVTYEYVRYHACTLLHSPNLPQVGGICSGLTKGMHFNCLYVIVQDSKKCIRSR
jgi:hypothetical protein